MAVNDSFAQLIEDIAQQVLQQVQLQVQTVITDAVNSRLDNIITEDRIHGIVSSKIQTNLESYKPDLTSFEQNLQQVSSQIVTDLQSAANKKVNELIQEQINSIDVNAALSGVISSRLDKDSQQFPFGKNTIPGLAVDSATLHVTGDQIFGGVVTNFASTGIEDKATQCQVTVLDQGTVFENTLYAPAVEVKGGATIDGDLTILGRITNNPAYEQLINDVGSKTIEKIGPELLDEHQKYIFDQIRIQGINLDKITIGDRLVIEDNRLTPVILHSRLQSVGVLRDLQTDGETFLSESLYVSNRRVGVNTMDPTAALSVWDEEVEISVGKKSKDIAEISAPRLQPMVLSSNRQDNITLMPDGSTVIPKLQLGNMLFSTSPNPPQHNAPRGHVVFNEQPNLGGPMGWVSLGDARWANFGIID